MHGNIFFVGSFSIHRSNNYSVYRMNESDWLAKQNENVSLIMTTVDDGNNSLVRYEMLRKNIFLLFHIRVI